MTRSLEGRLFIVGCPRSGTTLLQSFLAAHPDIISFPESHFFDNLIPHHEPRRYALGLAANRVDHKLKQFFQAIHRQELEKKLTKFVRFQFQYVRLFVNTLDTLAHEQNKRFWLEKTPEHLGYIDYIEKHVPKAKFIHIIRDGKDVVASLHEVTQKYPKVWGESWTLDYCIERWIEAIQISSEYQHKSNHRIVRYEDLADNPYTVLKPLCEFINVELDEGMLREYCSAAKSLIRDREVWKLSVTQALCNSNSKKFYQVLTPSEQDYVLSRLSKVDLNCLQLNSANS